MSYQKIDHIIQDWATNHNLTVYTSYQDYEVRSIDVVDEKGQKYQIWIDPPDHDGNIVVHAWDYKKRKMNYTTSEKDLGTCLDEAYKSILVWIRDN